MTPPIIIKKKRGGKGEGHHGGAWKVAYADFVTAMMAFFLLMWLLNATTEDQRKGIADYFDPSIPLSPVSGGGTDMLSGDTVFATDSLAHQNHGGESQSTLPDTEIAEAVREELSAVIEEDQFSVTLSDEGVVVELMEADDAPLFELGEAAPSDLLRKAIETMAETLSKSERRLRIIGHTDALKFRAGSEYTNWELSADRANVARRLILAEGFPHARLAAVVGKADQQPLVADRNAPQNRRISIIMLNSENLEPALEPR